jgi:5-(carboxyamino)imidazole ribonucleotide mutase
MSATSGYVKFHYGTSTTFELKIKALKGMDSLLSIVQMPAGVPVATVAINGAQNAAILAASIFALNFD